MTLGDSARGGGRGAGDEDRLMLTGDGPQRGPSHLRYRRLRFVTHRCTDTVSARRGMKLCGYVRP